MGTLLLIVLSLIFVGLAVYFWEVACRVVLLSFVALIVVLSVIGLVCGL